MQKNHNVIARVRKKKTEPFLQWNHHTVGRPAGRPPGQVRGCTNTLNHAGRRFSDDEVLCLKAIVTAQQKANEGSKRPVAWTKVAEQLGTGRTDNSVSKKWKEICQVREI